MSGFFDTLLSGIPGGSLVTALGNIGGALIGANGASDAADAVTGASNKAIDTLEADKTAGLGYIDTGAAGAQKLLQPLTAERPIMLPQYRGLTQQQQIGAADNLRNNQATLAASGLRGAGRAGVASIMDAGNRYEAAARGGNDAADLTALQTARTSADAAKSALANIDVNTGTTKANTEVGVGSQIASNQLATGNSLANIDLKGAGTLGSGIAAAGGNVGGGINFAQGYTSGNSPNAGGVQPYMTPGASNDPSLYQRSGAV